MRSKWFFVLAVAASLIVIAALAYVFFLSSPFLREEHVGGKYDCR